MSERAKKEEGEERKKDKLDWAGLDWTGLHMDVSYLHCLFVFLFLVFVCFFTAGMVLSV